MEPFENNDLDPEQEAVPPVPEEEIPLQPTQEEQAELLQEATAESRQEVPPEPRQEIPETPQPSAYHGAGAGRKESPYANSPYVMNQHPQEEYRYQPQTEPPKKPKKEAKSRKPRKLMGKKILACVLVAALVIGSCCITAFCVNRTWAENLEEVQAEYRTEIRKLQEQLDSLPASGRGSPQIPTDGSAMTPAQLYASCVDSVVAISTTLQTSGYYGTTQGTSAGSGFILTENGYVITNYHVVEGATSISVVTYDATAYTAQLVGYDSNNDIAVLKIDATGLPAATLGSSTDLVIGDMVVAIGNPLGTLTSTQTVGYVSGINREVATDSITTISMIQTDAAINPGNSGGPLFNMYGEVIGITTAKYSGTTNSGASIEGIGFAIPIDDVAPLVDELIDHGYVSSAYLGVSVTNVDAESAAMFGLTTSGAYVASVESGSAAEKAGIQPKDIIIALGDYEVTNVTTLTRTLRNFKAGDTTSIVIIRSGKEITLEITLDEKPQSIASDTVQPDSSMPSSGDYEEWYDYFRRYFGE